MSIPALPTANYVLVKIEDKRVSQTDELYVSVVSKTQAYEFKQYQSGANTVYVATTYTPPGDTVESRPLTQLVDSIDGTIGFYVEVFAGGVVPFTGGRIYFADQANAVPYSGGAPGGIAPDAPFTFDFVEFTVAFDATAQLIGFNVDTTQVDQFGISIFLQVTPIVRDFADGTGIVPTQTRAKIIGQFQAYTATGSKFTAYQGVASANRLLAPQHVIDDHPGSTTALQESFDAALYNLFNYYCAETGGGGHTLYLVGNGASGFEIFAGTVIKKFAAMDHTGNAGTYTVFQFVGTGYHYNGADAALTSVGAWGGATYQIFYPYFSDTNPANSFKAALSSGSKAPYWFGGFDAANQKYNLPRTSAGRMVLGGSGVFADNVSQNQYYVLYPPAAKNFDPVMLGNLENQLCTLLNRGITPHAVGATATLDNLHLRIGSNTASDLIYVDLSKLQQGTTNPIPWLSPPTSAVTSYVERQLIQGAKAPSGDKVYWNTLQGDIYLNKTRIQKFMVNANDITQPFKIIPPRLTGNRVMSAQFIFAAGGKVKAIEFEWESAAGLERSSVAFTFSYSPATTEAHYATLRLFTPYGQPTYSYSSGDLGPASAFSTGLVGANPASAPTSGMTVSGISFDNPTYVYQASTADPGAITIYSPQALPDGLNTNIIAFSKFYPVDSSNNPYGQWNAYAAFFHIGDPAHSVPPPTVDGKGYAFAFDDNGGYSSDITARLPNSQQSAPVVMTLTLTLLPWGSSGD
jgi:hypothetical protein